MPYDHALKDSPENKKDSKKTETAKDNTPLKKRKSRAVPKKQSAAELVKELKRVKATLELKEVELMRRERQLEEAESIGRMGHWYWKLGQDNLEWSTEIFRIFGFEKDAFEPTLFKLNELVHKTDIGRVNQVLQRAMIEEKDYDMEFRIHRPDGELRFIRCEGRCAKDGNGEVIALYGIMQDMTERNLYEEELRAERDRAERAYAAKSQFLANMSHELRTPLNAILGFSEMMEGQMLGPLGNDKYLEYVTSIRESGVHLLDLIGDILDMSKIEAGKYELDLQEVDVSKIMKSAMQMVLARAQEEKIRIDIEHNAPNGQKIIADRRAVLQILLNLLSNAVKFSHAEGQIILQSNARDNYLSFKVIDSGIGIPAHKLSSITQPFEQVSHSYARNHDGSGLGLAITKELVEMHGGVLAIESQVDEGTTVSVRLPYKAEIKAIN